MEENFYKAIENIKESTMDPEKTKKYILAIKKVFRRAFENCKDEFSESEIIEMCLEQYEEDLNFRCDAEKIFSKMLIYNAYKRLLNLYKSNKAQFDRILKEAKKREEEERFSTLVANVNLDESTVSAFRCILRKFNPKNEKKLMEYIRSEKNANGNILKYRMIEVIQFCVGTLEEYGFIDKYIEDSNGELEQLGVNELKFLKRNALADEYYNENGENVNVLEDVGVLDVFSKDNLLNMTVEDLEMMTAFYELKYLEERFELSKAMQTIKALDLWDEIFYEEDEAILNIDDEKIRSALKKDLALTYLCKNGVKVTPKINRQYKKFLNENNLNSDIDLKNEINSTMLEIVNLSEATMDVGILNCMTIQYLKDKDVKVKRWGIVTQNQDYADSREKDDLITIAVENQNFRGPLLIEIQERLLKGFLEVDKLDILRYKAKIEPEHSKIFSKLYIPTTKFFSEIAKKTYEENSQSEFLANLVGKKAKTIEER